MESPENRPVDQTGGQDCLDVSPERLRAMSPSQLEEALEKALSVMSEEEYDPAVIDAYLDELDRKTPVPGYPDAKTSYQEFWKKIQALPQASAGQSLRNGRPMRLRRVLRAGLAAALAAACLLGSMAAVQAAGVDVFGALARWTEEAFSFGPIPSQRMAEGSSDTQQQMDPVRDPSRPPEEFGEFSEELEARGVDSVMFPAYIPEDFSAEEHELYRQPTFGTLDFYIWYVKEEDTIMYDILYTPNGSSRIYEKDDQDVELYQSGGIEYYIFSNNDRNAAAWRTDGLEYSLTTSLAVSQLKSMLDSMYWA